MSEPEDLIAPSQLAKALGIRMQTIYSMVRSGKVEGYGEHPVKVSESAARAALDKSPRKHMRGVTRKPKAPKPTTRLRAGDMVAMPRRGGRTAVRQVTQVFVNGDGEVSSYQDTLEGKHGYCDPDLLQWQLAKGFAGVVAPEEVLGMILVQWVRDDKVQLAQSLEDWADSHGVALVVPELPAEPEVLSDDFEGPES